MLIAYISELRARRRREWHRRVYRLARKVTCGVNNPERAKREQSRWLDNWHLSGIVFASTAL